MHPGVVERAKQFFFRNFERTFVVLLVASLLAINYVVDDKIAFLSFYYLPIILAGFFGGRRFAVFAALFIALLVFYYQAVLGLQPDMLPGLHLGAMLTLVPWAGFLMLTGYVVGMLAEDRAQRLTDVKNAYLAVLELLTFHIESTEHHQQGHSHRVSVIADAFETLQMATPVRPAFPKWTALEEVERGSGKTFWREAVRALRTVAGKPEVIAAAQELKVV